MFAISKVRLDSDGRVTRVLWAEVNAASNLGVSNGVTAPVFEVVDAIHAGHQVLAHFSPGQAHLPERAFEVVEHADGRETIALAGPPAPGRELADITPLRS